MASVYLYFNLNPTLADAKEMLRDPKGLALATFFILLVINMPIIFGAENRSPIGAIVVALMRIAIIAFIGVLNFNELGLAHLRLDAINRGFQRPQPPRYRTAFDRMLAGKGIYLTILWWGAILYLFSPLGPGVETAMLTLPALLVTALCAYGIAYSNERYQIWYGEIWPNDDDGDGGNWDDEFSPDPTPQNHLTL